MSVLWWFINKFLAKDDLAEMNKSLTEIDDLETKRFEKLNEAQSLVRNNALIASLNRNMVKSSYYTIVHSKCMLILTSIITALTIILVLDIFNIIKH